MPDDVGLFVEDSMNLKIDEIDIEDSYLCHHGILNQKWGRRRYQNADGSLTPLGRVHYGVGAARKTAGKAVNTAKSIAEKASDYSHKRKSDALDKKIKKAEQKHELAEKKKRIDDLEKDTKRINDSITDPKTTRKSLNSMSDNEINNYLNRLRNIQSIKSLERDEGKSRFRKAAEDALIKSAAKAVGGLAGDAISQMGKNALDGLMNPPKETKDNKLPAGKLLDGAKSSKNNKPKKNNEPKKNNTSKKNNNSKNSESALSKITDIYKSAMDSSNADVKRGKDALSDMLNTIGVSSSPRRANQNAAKDFVSSIITDESRMLPPAKED